MPDESKAGFVPGDPRAREAGRKGAEAARRNREQGKAPNAGAPAAGKDKKPSGFAAQARVITGKTKARVTALVATGLVAVDEILARSTTTWATDKLDSDEVKLLTDAIVGTALRYPRFVKRMEQAAVAAEFAAIPTALVLIALPRLVRHGVVPKSLYTSVTPLLEEAAPPGYEPPDPEAPPPSPAEPRPTEPRAPEGGAAASDAGAYTDPVAPTTPQPTVVRPAEVAHAAPGQRFRPPPGVEPLAPTG